MRLKALVVLSNLSNKIIGSSVSGYDTPVDNRDGLIHCNVNDDETKNDELMMKVHLSSFVLDQVAFNMLSSRA